MRLLLYLLKASWRIVIAAVAVGGASGVATMAVIAMIHQALGSPGAGTMALAGGFTSLCGGVLVTQIGSQLLMVRLSQDAAHRLSQHLCERILDAPLRQLETEGDHRLLTALTSDVAIVAQAINGLPVVCMSIVTLACGMAYLGWLSMILFAGLCVFLILGLASYRAMESRANRHLKAARAMRDTLMRHIGTMIEGKKELKIHHRRREEFLGQVLETAHAALRERLVRGFSIQAISVSWGRLLFFVAIGLVLFVWPLVQPVEPAALTGYVLTILYMVTPLDLIIAWLPLIAMASISLRQIERLGLSIGAGESQGRPVTPIGSWRRLDLVGVTHTYYREHEGASFRLGPIDLTLEPGELVFLVGGNGSGKTTLAKLLTGLYVPEQGGIQVDGMPITDHNREDYRQLFSAVFAEAVLFESLLGMEAARLDEQAQDYLKQLQLDRAVAVREGVFSTTDLSKGQRKRLALVTAYLEDRPIYVFDEWAADQDPIFKEVFYRRILPSLKACGKAVLVITHDDRYFAEADRVIALCDGEMIHGDWEVARAIAEVGRSDRATAAAASPLST